MLTSLLILSSSLLPIFTYAAHSTVVYLTDPDLILLLQTLFNQLAGSIIIPITLLENLGLNTTTVIAYLQQLGYYILY